MAVFDTPELSAIQYDRLRGDTGASETLIPDETAELYFVEAQERYPNDVSKMIAYARVIVLRRIRASAAMLGRYAQNQSEEDLTKVFGNLGQMLEEAVAEVERVSDPPAAGQEAFFFGVATGGRGR